MKNSSVFIHPKALVEAEVKIGDRTRVWAFSHILTGVEIGEDCNICDHTFIESNVSLGDRVTVKCGVYIWDGITIKDDVFIGPGVTFTNDIMPRSKCYPIDYPQTLLKQGCSIGANSTILPGLTVGAWSMVGAASLVTKNIPDYALVYGIPARQQGWVCRCTNKLDFNSEGLATCECGCKFKQNSDVEVVVL